MNKLPLNLIYLKYFCDSVKHSSISKAAAENYVSQSAISQGIAKLEQSLSIELISHQPHRFKPTTEGQRLFERAKELFCQVQLLEEEVLSVKETPYGRIEFACTHSFALALLPLYLKKAKEAWPHLHISFRLGHTDMIKEWLKKGIIDFGIVLDNEDLSAFETQKIYQGFYQLYLLKEKLQDAKQLSFILSEERKETNLLRKAYNKKFGKELPVLMEVSSWEVIASLAEEGLGIGFFPDYVVHHRHQTLALFPFEMDPIPYALYAIFPKNQKPLRNLRVFLSLFNRQD